MMTNFTLSRGFHVRKYSPIFPQAIRRILRINSVRASLVASILCLLCVWHFAIPANRKVHLRLSKSPTLYHENLQFDCSTINKTFPLSKEAKLVSTKYGFQMYVYQSNDIVSDSIIENGAWEDVYVDLPNESAVIDIGGNICSWTLTWANLGHEVFTFEPLMKNAIFCMHSICINDFQDRVRIWNVGLGDEEKQCSLYSHPDNKGNMMTVCGEDKIDKPYIKRQEFPIKRLDDLILDGAFEFIKMDTEGYILPIVKGGKRVFGNAFAARIEIWNPSDVDAILEMTSWTRAKLYHGWFTGLRWLWIKHIKGKCNEDFWFSGFNRTRVV